MNIHELHQNEPLRRQEFPVCNDGVFVAHAGVCPLPRRVVAAMTKYLATASRGDQEDFFPEGVMLGTRRLATQLLNCSVEEVALIGPTSNALSLVANGLDWQPGDNVVFYPDDYPSNVVPWRELGRRGVELREVHPKALGAITLDQVGPLVDARTRLVALASAHFISGYRLDVDAIGSWLRSKDVLFCVDAIQTLGALLFPVSYVDFLAADAHKWLLGPCAAGILFVRREVQEKLRPTLLGWNNVKSPGFIAPAQVEFPPHAGRYEAGSPNLVGIVGLHAALSLIMEKGISAIEKTVLAHTRFLREALRQRGYELAGPGEAALSGITSFRREGSDMAALHEKLVARRVIASLRKTRDGHPWIRFSPHFYNTRSELEAVLRFI